MQNESPVDIVGFSDDGRRVIVVSKFIAEVWDTETHRPLGAKLKGTPTQSSRWTSASTAKSGDRLRRRHSENLGCGHRTSHRETAEA